VLQSQGYKDFITIAVKDLKNKINTEVYHNDKFEGDALQTLAYYEQKLGTKPITNISSDIYIYISNQSNASRSICYSEFE
jgi:hypothetical protein